MQNKSALITGVLTSLASPGLFASTVNYPAPQGSDLGRLRGDTTRVGLDFSSVIKREYGKQTPASKTAAKTAAK